MKAVIFDLGNVLVKYDWKSYLKQFGFPEETGKALADAIFLSAAWEEGDAGLYDEKTWLLAFIANAPKYENEIRMVYDTLGGCISRFEYTLDLIQSFREKGYRIYYLSNYSGYLKDASWESLSFLETFDGGVFSYQEKCLKPDEQIYRILLERYHLNPEDALFLDDRAENVAAAQKLGMNGIVWTPECAAGFLNETR